MDSQFIRNAWYPAAWSRDLSRILTTRRILGQRVVLYRKEAGTIAALDDACPHRLAPLSMGRLKGDNIECGYHGVTFDCGGQCVRIPGQPHVPANARVRSYPVVENMGLAWIWMGDPALAAPSTVFNLPQYHDPNWSAVEGDALEIGCHYLNLADNLCDPAHVSFVHLSTLGSAASEDIPVHSEKQGDKFLSWRWIIDAPAIPLFQKFGNFTGNVDRWHYYHYTPPSIAMVDFGSAPTGTGAPDGKLDKSSLQIFACHFITPVDADSCIDHWLFVKNFKTDSATTQAMIEQFRTAFDEDKAILEAIHLNEKEPRGTRPLRIAIDASPMRMRRAVDSLIEAEQSLAQSSGANAA